MHDQDFAVYLIVIMLLYVLSIAFLVGLFHQMSKVPSDEDVTRRTPTRK
jgi:hypothetical protein